jgi:hypothetical protein
MPSLSRAQNRFFHEMEENPAVRKRRGVSLKVAREFVNADRGRKIGKLPARKRKRVASR